MIYGACTSAEGYVIRGWLDLALRNTGMGLAGSMQQIWPRAGGQHFLCTSLSAGWRALVNFNVRTWLYLLRTILARPRAPLEYNVCFTQYINVVERKDKRYHDILQDKSEKSVLLTNSYMTIHFAIISFLSFLHCWHTKPDDWNGRM